MKIVVTGSKGMLGTDLVEILRDAGHEVVGVDVEEMDITDEQAVNDFLKTVKPELVINPAAYTNVDGCETNEDIAYQINAIGAKNLAATCKEIGARMLHISTDYVFDGEKGSPYVEDDPTCPLSAYGRTKLAGENFVREIIDQFYIVRIQWLFGKHGNNFVKTMLKFAKEKKEWMVVDDQYGSPTYTKDVCRAIVKLIKTQAYGVYHITNSGVCSWYEFTQEILRQAGVTGVTVSPCTTAEFPRPARRPMYSPLTHKVWLENGFEEIRGYKEALEEYLKEVSL